MTFECIDTSSAALSTMKPLVTPRFLADETVVVGQNIDTKIPEILRSFERTLSNPNENPALVVTTSGSTGTPKKTVLSSRALHASGLATEEFVGAPSAQWMLALPTHYVAGAQVLARSVLAGTSPAVTSSVAEGTSFTPTDFLRTFERIASSHRMLSLVPTQLHQLLEASSSTPEILQALQTFDGILLGGAPASASLLSSAAEQKIRVFTTYGSAETAGGCVYNGTPLPSVRVALEDSDDDAPNRIWLGGPTLANGYLADSQRTAEHFFTDRDGENWYLTDDLGTIRDSRLLVLGRADDIIISGGVKVSPAPIVQCLEEHPDVREAFVCGVQDSRWGQAVVAAVNVRRRRPHLERELGELTATLAPAQRPKHLEMMDSFPLLSTGKPDRTKLTSLLSSSYPSQSGTP